MKPLQLLNRGGLLLASLAAVPAFAQQAAPESDTDADLVTLSPFVVAADSNIGYQATNTLAGTRLNSNLKDIAASVSVVTPEFLKDTGAVDAETLLVYVTGAEVGGPGGNYSSLQPANNEGTLIVQAQMSAFGGPTRARGLAAFDGTRDYFRTSIPLDSYNSDGVVVNRGPNSMLFGLGSPAGIINNQLKKAGFTDKNLLTVGVSSFGSSRQVLDVNQDLIHNKLAVRLVALNERRNFQQKPAFSEDQRLYGTVTYQDRFLKNSRVLNKTTIRGTIETGRISGNDPYVAPPVDEISNWFRLGKPSWNVINDVWATKNGAIYDVTRPGLFRNPTAVFRDSTSSLPNAGYAGVNAGARQFVADSVVTPGGIVRSPMVLATTTRTGFSMQLAGDPMGRFTTSPSLTDRKVFDYRNNKLTGDYDRETGDMRASNITLEQLFLEDQSLGLELAYDKQAFYTKFRRLASPIEATLQVDINQVLMNGQANPDYGRVFFTSIPINGSSRWDTNAYRATAFYKLDFAKKAPNSIFAHLGRHVFTGLWNRQDTKGWSASGNTYVAGPNYTSTYGGSDTNYLSIGRMTWDSIHYVGPSVLNAQSLSDVSGVTRLTAQQLPAGEMSTYAWNKTTKAFENRTFSFIRNSDDGADLSYGIDVSRQLIDSIAGTAQSFFFNEKLVTTIGWRQDTVRIFDEGDNFNSSFTSNPLRAIDPNTGLIIRDNYFLPDHPGFRARESVFSYGAVLHAPQWLEKRLPFGSSISIHYNDSQNFQPTGRRFDSELHELGNVQGTTKEQGIAWSMFDGKLVARVNWYKTQQENVGIGVPNLANVMTIAGLAVRENTPAALSAAGFQLPPQAWRDFFSWTQSTVPTSNGGYEVSMKARGSITEVCNYTAKGTEFELTYNPTKHWRILLDATREESVRSGSGQAMARIIEQMLPQWGDGVGTDQAGEVLYTNSTRTMTMRQDAERNIIDPYRAFVLQDNGSAREVRKWRWNAVTSYDFSKKSSLSGFRVGGAMRWQDKSVIGFPVAYNANVKDYLPVVSKPFYGPTDFKVDLWVGYKFAPIFKGRVLPDLQLNVRNVGDVGKLVPVAANPDGKVVGYWTGEGRTFNLTASFGF